MKDNLFLNDESNEKIKLILDHFENGNLTGIKATAYNYLIEYTEGLIYSTLEGNRLVSLCVEILEEASDL